MIGGVAIYVELDGRRVQICAVSYLYPVVAYSAVAFEFFVVAVAVSIALQQRSEVDISRLILFSKLPLAARPHRSYCNVA